MRLIPYYLERSAAVRALAAATTGSDARRTLLMLAEQWEALAAQAAKLEEAQGSRDALVHAQKLDDPSN